MKLGLFTAAFPGKTLEEVAAWAAENGFEALELACWPLGKATRRYAGVTTVDVEDFDATKAKEVQAVLDNYGLDDIRTAVTLNQGRAKIEVSGNVTLETVSTLADTGVDYISVGALTKNIQAIDLSMRIQLDL